MTDSEPNTTSGDIISVPTLEEEIAFTENRLAPSLGEVSVRGAFWTVAATLATKVLAFLSEIAISWFLFPDQMGLVASAFSITSIAELLTCGGLVSVMVQRQSPIERESPDVFWLSLNLHLIATVVAIALAPVAGIIFGDSRVRPLIIVVALSWPISSLTVVYGIKLTRDLRFKTYAGIQTTTGIIAAIGPLAFAALGCGAYSLVLPIYFSSVATLILARRAAGPLPLRGANPRRWPALIFPTLWLTAQSLGTAIQGYGTTFIIGAELKNPAIAGLYFWGFSLSGQAVFLLVTSLRGVLFPTLAKLNEEPQRQYAAFQRGLRLMMFAAVPVCLLQALTAMPLILLFFPNRWHGVIPVVVYLSIGSMTQPMQVMAYAVLMARGRFRTVTLLSLLQGLTIIVAGMIGARFLTAEIIAAWTAGALLFNGLLIGWFGERLFGHGWIALIDSFYRIIVPAIGCGGLGWLACESAAKFGLVAQLAAGSTVCIAVYIMLVLVFARVDMLELLKRLRLDRIVRFLEGQPA